ncbi:hypothetical protein D3C80_2137890 [compost metagenome]
MKITSRSSRSVDVFRRFGVEIEQAVVMSDQISSAYMLGERDRFRECKIAGNTVVREFGSATVYR